MWSHCLHLKHLTFADPAGGRQQLRDGHSYILCPMPSQVKQRIISRRCQDGGNRVVAEVKAATFCVRVSTLLFNSLTSEPSMTAATWV